MVDTSLSFVVSSSTQLGKLCTSCITSRLNPQRPDERFLLAAGKLYEYLLHWLKGTHLATTNASRLTPPHISAASEVAAQQRIAVHFGSLAKSQKHEAETIDKIQHLQHVAWCI